MLSFVSSLPAAPAADLVTSLPGFGDLSSLPFKVYSGYLTVPGPFTRMPPSELDPSTCLLACFTTLVAPSTWPAQTHSILRECRQGSLDR